MDERRDLMDREELRWAVAEALFDASDDLRPEDNWPDDDAKYGRAAAAVLAVPAIADALARDAKVAEWVRQGADGGVMQNVLPIHHLYAPSPGDRDDSEEQR